MGKVGNMLGSGFSGSVQKSYQYEQCSIHSNENNSPTNETKACDTGYEYSN